MKLKRDQCKHCESRALEEEPGHFVCLYCDHTWDDGRIRSADDARRAIAKARARRAADEELAREGTPELAAELHELYCESAEADGWLEIPAADSWAERELDARLARRVHRTQVRRARLLLEGLGYVRTLAAPTRQRLKEIAAEHRRDGRRPPIFVKVLQPAEH
jgi:hypothetical protein